MIEGLPEHRNVMEEFGLVSWQLEEALAAQESALRIAELEDKHQALYTKFSISAKGAALSVN